MSRREEELNAVALVEDSLYEIALLTSLEYNVPEHRVE